MRARPLAPIWAGVLLATASSSTCFAQEAFVGGFGHNLDLGITAKPREHGADVELGFRTGRLAATRLIELRAYGLGSFNSDHGVNFASIGLVLRVKLGRGLYLQPGLGGAVQTGDAHEYQYRPDRLSPGSRFLFQPELALGVPLGHRFAAELAYVHISNAHLSPQNPGMDDVGLRFLYSFPR